MQLSEGASVGDEIELVVRGTNVPATVTAVDPDLARINAGRLTRTAFVPLEALAAEVPPAQQQHGIRQGISPKATASLVAQGTDDRDAIGALSAE